MYGKDYDYAASRLIDSVVRLVESGEPVIVEDISVRTGETFVTRLRDNAYFSVALDDLDVKPVPLGWCNTRYGGTYLMRIPKRRDWKQGLRRGTCFSSKVRYDNIPRADLAACILGKYPTITSLLAKLPRVVVGWSRRWALCQDELYFTNLGCVGRVENGKPKLFADFVFLKESLHQHSNGVLTL